MFRYGLVSILLVLAISCGGRNALDQPVTPEGSAPGSSGPPISFEPNQGQAGADVQFLARTNGYNLYLSGGKITFDITVSMPSADKDSLIAPNGIVTYAGESAVLEFSLVGNQVDISAAGQKKLPGVSNYFIGQDSSKWLTGVEQYEQVLIKEIYPGIDVVFYGKNRMVEHDFTVHPGADPKLIKMKIDGASMINILESGELEVVISKDAHLTMKKPVIYQGSLANKTLIDGGYELLEGNVVGFKIGEYDPEMDLTIDPVTLTYSTFLGGSENDITFGIAVDSSGNAYTVGYAKSTSGIATNGAYDTTLSGNFDAFITKIDSTGTANTFTTYFGGTDGNDFASSIQVDSSNTIYITGYTTSTDLPTAGTTTCSGVLTTSNSSGYYAAFVTHFNSTGTALVFSCYYGVGDTAGAFTSGAQLSLDTSLSGCTGAGVACVILVGSTNVSTASILGISGTAQAVYGGGSADAFVAKLIYSGSTVIVTAATYLGGSGRDLGTGIVDEHIVDPPISPSIPYVTGETRSSDFTTTAGVVKTSLGGSQDAFVVKLAGNLSARTYSTYVGGTGVDGSSGIALLSGSAYITGTTTSTDLATTNAYQTSNGGGKDIYVAKLNSGATAFTYLTYFGGTGDDETLGFQSIAVDTSGRAFVTGKTTSTTGFPTTISGIKTTGGANSYPSQESFPGGTSSGFIIQNNASDTSAGAIRFSTYLGGSTSGKSDLGVGIALDTSGNAYVVGVAATTNFPATTGALDISHNGGFDGFIAKLTPPPFFNTTGKATTAIGSGDDSAFAVALQSDGKIVVAGEVVLTSLDFGAARYNTNGSLDTSFDTDGKLTTAIGSGDDTADAIAIQSDGKVVVAGYAEDGIDNDFVVARYNTDGALDTSFDTDGKVVTSVATDDGAYGVALQSDGKIVAVGPASNGTNYDFAVVRYNTNGSLDTSFDTDGKVITTIGSGDDLAYAVAIQSDGKIVVAGESFNGTNYDFAVVRYNTNGSLDTDFDGDGKATTSILTTDNKPRVVAIQGDGKIVVAGTFYNGTDYDFAVIRYNTTGSLDTSFDSDGKVTTAVGITTDIPRAIALQSDGKIIVAGETLVGSTIDFALVRYNTNGSLDTSFDTDGKVITTIGSGADVAHGVAIQSDGRIVAAGYSNNGSNVDFAVVRYNTDGSLDAQ